jgi:predicted TIM-barrel fold metal-dependent hydrolase
LRYADKDLLDCVDELEPYRITVTLASGKGSTEPQEHSVFMVKPLMLKRVAGEKLGASTGASKRVVVGYGSDEVRRQRPGDRVHEDDFQGRLEDMDTEGRDIDFMIPGTWAYGAPAIAPHLEKGLYAAYHRYMADYCSTDPRRLKSQVLVPGTDPEWGAQTIKELADEDWVSAVWPLLPEGFPLDDPDLEPIWAAANEADLPIMYHSFTLETPYFPGYRDVWDNAAMGRCAGQTWGGQRFLSFMMMSGVLDRYPQLRIACLETGHGWLPHWLLRLTRQMEYVSGAVPADLKHTPLEYAQMGRVFCGIDLSEGPEMTKAVIDLLGDHVLMFESDYPHPETVFPDHVDSVIAWQDVLGEEALRKLMFDNAARFFRLGSIPWSE